MTGGEHGIVSLGGGAGRLHRLPGRERAQVRFCFDGETLCAMEDDTILTAVLVNRGKLRNSEWRREPRAGFCLMGACQDCWIWFDDGARVRACSTPIRDGHRLLSRSPLEPAP